MDYSTHRLFAALKRDFGKKRKLITITVSAEEGLLLRHQTLILQWERQTREDPKHVRSCSVFSHVRAFLFPHLPPGLSLSWFFTRSWNQLYCTAPAQWDEMPIGAAWPEKDQCRRGTWSDQPYDIPDPGGELSATATAVMAELPAWSICPGLTSWPVSWKHQPKSYFCRLYYPISSLPSGSVGFVSSRKVATIPNTELKNRTPSPPRQGLCDWIRDFDRFWLSLFCRTKQFPFQCSLFWCFSFYVFQSINLKPLAWILWSVCRGRKQAEVSVYQTLNLV